MRPLLTNLWRTGCAAATVAAVLLTTNHPAGANETRVVGQRNWTAPLLATSNLAGHFPAVAGTTAAAGGTLNSPNGMAVDLLGNLYVANPTVDQVTIYGPGHKYLNKIVGGLNYPTDVAVEYGGNILVTNVNGNNVTIYDKALTYQGALTTANFINPQQIYVDPDNDIWVLDTAGQLHTFLDNGVLVSTVATGGLTVGPWGPYVTVWNVALLGGARIEEYQSRGQAIHDGVTLTNTVSDAPTAAYETQDNLGQQYVTDPTNNRVLIYSAFPSQVIDSIATPFTPWGIAVDSKRGSVYVSFPYMNEVLVYALAYPHKLLATIM